jgi:PAS domain-containing protein
LRGWNRRRNIRVDRQADQTAAFRRAGRDIFIRDRELSLSHLEGIRPQVEPDVIALEDIVRAVQNRGSAPDSERRLYKLLQGLPAAIYTTDAEGRITFYNDAAVALWGACTGPTANRCRTTSVRWPSR